MKYSVEFIEMIHRIQRTNISYIYMQVSSILQDIHVFPLGRSSALFHSLLSIKYSLLVSVTTFILHMLRMEWYTFRSQQVRTVSSWIHNIIPLAISWYQGKSQQMFIFKTFETFHRKLNYHISRAIQPLIRQLPRPIAKVNKTSPNHALCLQ